MPPAQSAPPALWPLLAMLAALFLLSIFHSVFFGDARDTGAMRAGNCAGGCYPSPCRELFPHESQAACAILRLRMLGGTVSRQVS
jgi:hypothetical protein